MPRPALGSAVTFAVFAGAYLAAPHAAVSELLWLLAATTLLGVAVRASRRTTGSRGPWMAITVGMAFNVAGDYVFAYNTVIAQVEAFPTAGDALYLMSYPFMALGLAGLARTTRTDGWLRPTVDGAVLAVVASMGAWIFFIEPALEAGGQPFLARVVGAAYPVGDLLLLVICAQLVVRPVRRAPQVVLLLAAIALNLVGDVIYSVLETQDAYAAPHPVDLVWALSYAAIAAAVVARAREGGRRDALRMAPSLDPSPARLAMLGTAAVAAPLLHLVAHLMGRSGHDLELLLGTSVLLGLVILRLWLMAVDLRTSRDDLAHRRTHDELTGLANRAAFTRVARQRDVAAATVLLVDVDIFRSVNEAFGPDTGDAVLREVGEVLRDVVGTEAVVARLSGDEFAVLLDAPLSVGEAHAADIVVAARRSVEAGPHTVPISLSVGVAPLGAGDNPLLRAQEALREAKRSGRDTHVVLGPPRGPGAPVPAGTV